MVDKRRHKRVKVKLNLVVSNIFDQNADMIKIDSPIEVKDVSRSGIGFITKSILPMNYYFNAALTFDDEDSILYSVVKIIRCEALEDDEYVSLWAWLPFSDISLINLKRNNIC